MAKVEVVDLKRKRVGEIELSDDIFSVDVNEPLVLQVINAQRAAMRQGTAATKTKGLVRGGGKKPFKQKGTGNARQGSSRSPLMPGGGSNFGPVPRSYKQNTLKKMVRGALKSVLSDKLKNSHMIVVDSWKLDAPKTKSLSGILSKGLNVSKVLVVDESNRNLSLASRNIPTVAYLTPAKLNVYDLVRYDWLVVSKSAALKINELFANT